MSAICTEFVQNAWKKDLCSNCFKAKADHASPKGADASGAREPPVDVGKTSPAKKAPNETYASSKQTIMEMHKSMVASVVGKSLSSLNHKNNVLNHNNNNNSSSAANNNHSASNGVTSGRYVKNTASPRKIVSSGVHLWEVGRMPDQSHPEVTVVVSNGVNGKDPPVKDDLVDAGSSNGNRVSEAEGQVVSGILKDAKPVKLLQVTSNGQQPRRGSVGFLDGSPKVIGYGGDDYDWGDDPESSEEPSDVDSLENYDLTDEDRAFSQLTDRNTEYNADNTNLLLHQPAKTLVTSSCKGTSLVDKLSPQSFYSMPTSRASTSSDRAKNFVRANVSNGTKEPATFLDDDEEEEEEEEDEDDGTMIVKVLPDPGSSPNPVASRAGCETIPSRKYPSVARTSVQQLFSEEPVTAAELRAASEKLRPLDAGSRPETESPSSSETLPIRDCNGAEPECSPYGVTRLADIAKDNAEPEVASSSPPVIPKCPPPAPNDEVQKWPVLSKNTTPTNSVRAPMGNLPSGKSTPILGSLAHDQKVVTSAPLPTVAKEEPCGSPKSTIGICSTFQSPAHKDPDAKFRNREYAAVNYSCHYASSYIKTGVGLQPNSTSGPDRAALSPSSTLPPTPLTNPYSSTAILKGLPRQQSSPEHSPQKPPVTKPKPKLLVKPPTSPKIPEGGFPVLGLEPVKEGSPAKNSSGNMDTTGANAEIEDSGVVSTSLTENVSDGQVSPEVGGDPLQPGTGFDSKVTALTNALDLNKRGPKRQAPRPPTASSQDPLAFKGDDRSSVTSFPSYASVANGEPQASPTGSTPHPTPDHHHHHHHHQSLSSIVHSSPNASLISMTCESGHSPAATVHHSSLPPSVMTTSTPNLPSYESHVAFRSGTSKENKTKKSRFSLKKLLKFGSKDDHDDTKWKAKSSLLHGESSHHHERRTKLEILHPIDLIHSTRNDNLPPPSLDKSSTGTSSSSKASSVDSHQGSQTVVDEIQGQMESATDTEVHQGSVSSAVDDQPSSIRSKPPPPLRSRSSLDDPSKDKPSRPPPPTKRTHPLATGQGLSDSLEDIHDSTPNRKSKVKSGGSLQHGDKRNSCYSTSMEYANLGDIRNNLAPKKPGRCVSSSMMDIAYTEQDSLNSSHRSTSNEDISKMKDSCPKSFTNKIEEVTYYEPPQDQSLEQVQYDTLDDLYADQCSVVTNRIEPSYDGLNPAFVESSDLVRNGSPSGVPHQKAHLDAEHPIGGSDGSDCCSKVYERVVLKRGNLEKVYSKFPVLGDSGSVASTAVGDVDDTIPSDVGAVFWPRRKSSRLSLRKAKTVVHKNLEDNYGAVVSANHQTLTQILEQVSVTQLTAASKIKLLEEVPPHWSDFKLLEDSQVTMIGDKAFYSAVWQQNVELTLMASQEPLCATSQSTRNPCVLVPIVEFEDAIPFSLFSKPSTHSEDGFCHGTVWVMERMRVETLNSIAESLHLQSQTDMEAYEREVCFILLQLINALKHLQVLGIEEVDSNCSDFILIMKSNDTNYRLAILPKPSSVSDGYRTPSSTVREKLSLCRQALAVMFLLFEADAPVPRKGLDHDRLEIPSRIPSREAFQRIAEILQQERATSLSQAKLLLEYLLWGPTDLNGEGRANHCGSVSGDLSDQEMAFQRWLDLERATVLNNLIRTQSLWQIRLTVFEEYMLSFLVRTCAKMLREAAHQLQANQSKNS